MGRSLAIALVASVGLLPSFAVEKVKFDRGDADKANYKATPKALFFIEGEEVPEYDMVKYVRRVRWHLARSRTQYECMPVTCELISGGGSWCRRCSTPPSRGRDFSTTLPSLTRLHCLSSGLIGRSGGEHLLRSRYRAPSFDVRWI
jgi:hypothetical protein